MTEYMKKPETGEHKMRLLVPLDGSSMAESVLPIVESLATHCAAEVILLHVIEKKAPATRHGERHLRSVAEAEEYLRNISTRLRSAGIVVESHVHPNEEDDVAKSVVDHAAEMNPSFVVICTHGHGGLKKILFGSIAQQALHRGTWPILLVPPSSADKSLSPKFQRILVPLDGRHGHELALKVVTPIARAFGAELFLTLVIPTRSELSDEQGLSSRFLPMATKAILDLAVEGSKKYLAEIIGECQSQNLNARAEVLRGNTVAELLDHSDKVQADLIVITSHGRVGIDALFTGSVTQRIIGKTGQPLLLVRTAEGQSG